MSRAPIRIAEHIILDQLTEHYPAHLSKEELIGVVSCKLVDASDVGDALTHLLAQRVIHRQIGADYYWLVRPIAYIRQIEWEPSIAPSGTP
jgi:hypothetical protein